MRRIKEKNREVIDKRRGKEIIKKNK